MMEGPTCPCTKLRAAAEDSTTTAALGSPDPRAEALTIRDRPRPARPHSQSLTSRLVIGRVQEVASLQRAVRFIGATPGNGPILLSVGLLPHEQPASRDHHLSVLLYVALLACATLVVVLGTQVAKLRSELREARWQALHPAVGDWLPPLPAITLSGDSVTIGQGSAWSRQVLFVFNTRSAFCLQTLPAWSRIATRLADHDGVPIVGWSQDADSVTRAYVSAHDLTFPVVAGTPARHFAMYRVRGVPATLVIDDHGQIIYFVPGPVMRTAEDSIVALGTSIAIRRDMFEASNAYWRMAPTCPSPHAGVRAMDKSPQQATRKKGAGRRITTLAPGPRALWLARRDPRPPARRARGRFERSPGRAL